MTLDSVRSELLVAKGATLLPKGHSKGSTQLQAVAAAKRLCISVFKVKRGVPVLVWMISPEPHGEKGLLFHNVAGNSICGT